ncbi:uncharacterized protein LOC112602121 [Melanaphis sacchari]|uniref:uncharacterized protein LOC112602121 n=1 Tax=Melanaphis sacchari TaxID=742174 RepID=UPI000DC15227|nr:uncharacterized protein LOC112602121 [Melanaphis sacchari]
MKSFSVITVSIVLAFIAANTSAHESFTGQNVCDIKYHFHENLASVITDDVGIKLINELRQNYKNICLDPMAHNSIVSLVDGIIDMTTNTNVSQTLGNTFYWARKIMKDPKFRAVWHETMKGVNMSLDNFEVTQQVTDTLFDQLSALLNHPKFDSTFESVVKNLSMLINFRKNMFSKAGSFLSKQKRHFRDGRQ